MDDTLPAADVCADATGHEDRVLTLREHMVDEIQAQRLAEMFKMLADPTRLRIITALAEGEVCVHELADALKLSQSAVSHQLRLLRQQGLVRTRRVGRHVYYHLDDEHVYHLLRQALEHVEHL